MMEPKPATTSREARPWLRITLFLLCVEKVIQHVVVTFAFAVDWGGIRASVAFPYEILMVAGAVLASLFALAAWWVMRRDSWARGLIIALALTDIVGEFAAQSRVAITITVSLLVAVALLIAALLYRPRSDARSVAHTSAPDA